MTISAQFEYLSDKKTSEIQNCLKEGTTFTPFLDGLSLHLVGMAHGNVSLVLQDISQGYFQFKRTSV